MADFLSDFGNSVGDKVLPNGDALNRKIDGQRDVFLKGISSTKFGKKEDPTYLHFRFIFDFGETTFMDPETFLPPSPLFRPVSNTNEKGELNAQTGQALNNLAGELGGFRKDGTIQSSDLRNDLRKVEEKGAGGFSSDLDFFYGTKFVINSRAETGAFNINGGGLGYMGAQSFLSQRSIKRKQMLDSFKKGLKFINEKCPYYFQSISGLDQILKVDIKNLHKAGGKPQRMGTLTIDCLESIDMRIFSLSELYRKAIYDYTYHRMMLPENLRKFRMWLVVSEIRNIQLSYGINDVLNPFSIPSVANAANFLDRFNSQTGLLDQAQGLLQKSTNTTDIGQDKFGSYTLGPYAFIYQFDQCEFDFDESYPSFSSIDNKGGSAVTNKFKIHVGRVKDYKIQFNELSDLIQKQDNIKQMVLSDVWGARTSNYSDYDYSGSTGISSVDFSNAPNPAEYFAQMASNFITNSVADLKDQGVQILQGALLGNIYGLGGFDPRSQFRSYTNFDDINAKASPLKIPDPRKDNSPQGSGLGGPGQRQYPDINEDAYTGVPSTTQQNLGTAYSGTPGNPGTASGDVYSNNPGTDLGLPDREYPKPGGDEYKNVPGSDSGVPGRVYPLVKGDAYLNNPGSDLGLPARQYPEPGGDEYNDVPGNSLGVPDRNYPDLNDDAYSSNPGSDLGLPDRQYPGINEDVYPSGVIQETDNIGKVYDDSSNSYSNVNEKEYEESQSTPIENIGDVYPDSVNKYPEINDKVYTQNIELGDENLGEVYKDVKNDYPSVNEVSYEIPPNVNSQLNEDVYKTVPGRDLGGAGRNYESVNDSQYGGSNRPVNISNIGRVYPSARNENN
jgi:hypothetical protein